MPTGTLYIVATPIGNLEDMTFRAVRVLREADLIAAEDTRHSRKLLSHFGITGQVTSYFDHNKNIKGQMILNRLKKGASVALITDAGTPCISDPGYQLVRDAIDAGITIVPVPGPSAAIAALSAAGLATDSFTFAGFLPNRQGKRRERLGELKNEPRVVILYEAPQRFHATLEDILAVCGDRKTVVGRELTKIHEEFLRGSASEILELMSDREARGELVILISPDQPALKEAVSPDLLLQRFMASGISLKDAVQLTVGETGLPRREVYAAAVRLKEAQAEQRNGGR